MKYWMQRSIEAQVRLNRLRQVRPTSRGHEDRLLIQQKHAMRTAELTAERAARGD